MRFSLCQVGDVLTEFADMLDVSLMLFDEPGALLPESLFDLFQDFDFLRTLGHLSDSIFVASHKLGFFTLEARFFSLKVCLFSFEIYFFSFNDCLFSFEIRFFSFEARIGLFKRIDFLISNARMLQRLFLVRCQRGLFLPQLRIDPRQLLDFAVTFGKQSRALVTRASQTAQLLLELVPALGESGTLLRFALASMLGLITQLAGLASLRITEFRIRRQDVQQCFRFSETASLMKPEGEPL
ncbi:hypothetical protein DID99_34365 [Burkholderia sp. Bp8986]|nr:hypothetical protein DID99_34365 [Burkholderia sp. Bp8986]